MTHEKATERCMSHEHFLTNLNEDIQWCVFCGSIKIKGRVKVPDTYIEIHKLRNFATNTRCDKYEDSK